jgi:Fic family protein
MDTIVDMINISTLIISPEVLELISEIEEFKGAWRSLGTLAPERLRALKHIATIESIGSSTRIEGSQLSDKQVAELLGQLSTQSFKSRDAQEVAGYAQVMELVFSNHAYIPLTENFVHQLHRDLLQFSTKDAHHRGRYKTVSNSVAAFDENGKQVAVVFETAKPFDTPGLMQELLEWVKHAKAHKAAHPLLVVAVFVVVFLEIHPFQDGNGRLSRILTTLLMLHMGYAYVPYSSLESIIEENKSGYYQALRQTQGTIRTDSPNWQPWVLFFLRALCSQMRRLKAKVEREKMLLAKLPELSANIVDLVKERGTLTVLEATIALGGSRNTIKRHLQKLVLNGHLVKQGAGRGVWYVLP